MEFDKLPNKKIRLLKSVRKIIEKRIPLASDEDWDNVKRFIPPLSGSHAKCKHFGCGASLTLREQLFGDKCITHANP